MSDPRNGRRLTTGELLVLLSGLPGTGKSTLARHLAARIGATHLRIDTIEETLTRSGLEPGPLGYGIAYAIAADQLRLGSRVVVDAVNAIAIVRSAWRSVANGAGASFVTFEILCSDAEEHRRRVESRLAETGAGPTWQDVLARPFEPWSPPARRIETAGRSPEDALNALLAMLDGNG